MLPPGLFHLAVDHFLSRVFREFSCRELLPKFLIAKPLGSMNLPIRLGPSSSRSEATVIVARRLPLMTLCSLAAGESCSNIGAMAVVVKGEALEAGEATAAPEEEMVHCRSVTHGDSSQ